MTWACVNSMFNTNTHAPAVLEDGLSGHQGFVGEPEFLFSLVSEALAEFQKQKFPHWTNICWALAVCSGHLLCPVPEEPRMKYKVRRLNMVTTQNWQGHRAGDGRWFRRGHGHDHGVGPGGTSAEEVKSCKKMFRFVKVLNQKLSFPLFSCGLRAFGEC